MAAPVEDACDRVEAFLAAGVPDLQLEEALLVHVRHHRRELRPDRHLVLLRERVVTHPLYDARLPHPTVPD